MYRSRADACLPQPYAEGGESVVASQISRRLWSSSWNRPGARRRPRILYLANRKILTDQIQDLFRTALCRTTGRPDSAQDTTSE